MSEQVLPPSLWDCNYRTGLPLSGSCETPESIGAASPADVETAKAEAIAAGNAAVGAHDESASAHGALAGLAPIRALLKDGRQDILFPVITDSTADSTAEWGYLLGQKLAALYPNWTIRQQFWNTSDNYWWSNDGQTDWRTLQTGTAGERYFRATASTAINLPATLPQVPATRFSFTVDTSFDDLAAAKTAQANILKKNGTSAGNRGFYSFVWDSGGNLRVGFSWSEDGTNFIDKASGNFPASIVSGTRFKIKVVFDGADAGNGGNYTVKFYYRIAGEANFTQVGATAAGAAPSSIYATTAQWTALSGYVGNCYDVEVRSTTTNGYDLLPRIMDAWAPVVAANASIQGAPVLVLQLGARASAAMSTWTGLDVFGKMFVDHRTPAFMVALGHNHGSQLPAAYFSDADALLAAVKVVLPNSVPIFSTQNPELSTYVDWRAHAIRFAALPLWCARNACLFVDPHTAFALVGDYATYINADGIHPLPAGSDLWASYYAGLLS